MTSDAPRWAAPGRVNLIGEHVDYAEGLCLPFAIAERTVVEATPRTDGRVRLRSVSESDAVEVALDQLGPGSPAGWAGYAAGVLWALREAGYTIGGLDLSVVDTVPLGAGLSSSAALECATALAVDDLNGLGLGDSADGRRELARACMRAENDVVGAATGGMDQAASLLAEEGHALLLDTRDGATRQVPFAPADDGLRMLVIDTKVRHRLADGQYGQRRAAVEKAAEVLGLHSLREANDATSGGSTGSCCAVPATSSRRSPACGRSWRCWTTAGSPTSARCSTPRTPRSRTTTRCRAGSWTWPERSPAPPVRSGRG